MRASGYVPPATGDIEITFSFYPPNNRGDRTNYPNRCKAMIDGIAEALGVNDKRFLPNYQHFPAEKPGRVEIEIAYPACAILASQVAIASYESGLSNDDRQSKKAVA